MCQYEYAKDGDTFIYKCSKVVLVAYLAARSNVAGLNLQRSIGEQVGEEKQENIQDGVLCGKRKRKESNLYQLDVPGICTLCTRRNPTMVVCKMLFRIYSYYYRDLFRRY